MHLPAFHVKRAADPVTAARPCDGGSRSRALPGVRARPCREQCVAGSPRNPHSSASRPARRAGAQVLPVTLRGRLHPMFHVEHEAPHLRSTRDRFAGERASDTGPSTTASWLASISLDRSHGLDLHWASWARAPIRDRERSDDSDNHQRHRPTSELAAPICSDEIATALEPASRPLTTDRGRCFT